MGTRLTSFSTAGVDQQEQSLSASESCLLPSPLPETLSALRRGDNYWGRISPGFYPGHVVGKDFNAARWGLGRLDLFL